MHLEELAEDLEQVPELADPAALVVAALVEVVPQLKLAGTAETAELMAAAEEEAPVTLGRQTETAETAELTAAAAAELMAAELEVAAELMVGMEEDQAVTGQTAPSLQTLYFLWLHSFLLAHTYPIVLAVFVLAAAAAAAVTVEKEEHPPAVAAAAAAVTVEMAETHLPMEAAAGETMEDREGKVLH